MKKLLLLDKDGTLISPKSGAKFVNSPWDQAAIPGVQEAIDAYVSADWKPVIISNQGGVAAGHKTLEEAILEMRFVLELFPAIEEAYFCPDFEGEECWKVWSDCSEQHRIKYQNEIVLMPRGYDAREIDNYVDGISPEKNFRKPGPGMLRLAIDNHTASESLFVGDRPEDEGAAMAAKIPFKWAKDWLIF